MSSISAIGRIAVVDQQPINVGTMPDLVSSLMRLCARGQGFTLFTLNLDHLVKRRRDPQFRAAYSRATLVSADGWPVALLARRQGVEVERVTGADLVDPLCEAAARNSVPLFFLGSTQDSLEAAADILRARHPGLDIRGVAAPPMGFDPVSSDAVALAETVAASGAKICFVALGAPKQELFSDAMAARHPHLGFLCVGAALDFISGRQRRAPRIVQKLRGEWLWRLASEPRRMALRYGTCAVVLADVMLKLTAGRGT